MRLRDTVWLGSESDYSSGLHFYSDIGTHWYSVSDCGSESDGISDMTSVVLYCSIVLPISPVYHYQLILQN